MKAKIRRLFRKLGNLLSSDIYEVLRQLVASVEKLSDDALSINHKLDQNQTMLSQVISEARIDNKTQQITEPEISFGSRVYFFML